MPKFKEETIQWSEDKKDKQWSEDIKDKQWSEDKKDNTMVRR
jgi:hypothetical protein